MNLPTVLSSKHKFKDLKVYGSAEWLANGQKKYRRVFDRAEATFVYVELSFYNKMFDEEDWSISILFKIYGIKDGERKELGEVPMEKKVSKDQYIIYIHQAWGNKLPKVYWVAGEYEWEAYIDGHLTGNCKFWIEDIGLATAEQNPYFSLQAIKLYEGSNEGVPADKRTYMKKFDSKQTRYIFAEFTIKNTVTDNPWHCELNFKFYNDAHQLKGEANELIKIQPEQEQISMVIGWGSNDKTTWFEDHYSLHVLFMDHLIAILPFEVASDSEEGMNEIIVPNGYHIITPATTKNNADPQNFDEVMSELDGLIGLSTVKRSIKQYAEYLKFLKIRTERGFEDSHNINLHTIFTGNPGTGKTTVAKMLGQIYKNLGLLSKGHVHEADRAELVGEYIGQTAPKVKEAIKQARGGILFIDEAYALARAKDDAKDFGREVLEILIKEMSDGPGDIAVIMAGYPNEMRTFVETNPGLRSRIAQIFDFPDYVPDELLQIAEYAAQKRRVELSPQARAFLFDKIVDAYRNRDRYFGNARHIYTLVDTAKLQLGLRVMKNENPKQLPRERLSTILVEDVAHVFDAKERRITDIPIDEALLEEALQQLNELPGLNTVKKEINELVSLVRFYREMNKGVLNRFSLHSVFTGNPGTGKTTVARILAKIFKALGVLERGHLVECDRQSLVAGYVGQTAIKTAEKISEAVGGVLFIDEAYALTERNGTDYGHEAIETLIKRMEDQKGEFAVVAAGYTNNMKLFLETNPGLKSRIDRVIVFEDYLPDELLQIAVHYLKKENFELTAEANEQLKHYFQFLYNTKDKFFGNGRAVVKTVQDIIKAQHLRLANIPTEHRNHDILRLITLEDLKDFDEKKALSGGRKQLGFGRAMTTTGGGM